MPARRPDRGADHRDGWRWEPYAVDGTDVEAARQQLQRLMREAEADIAEVLSNEGWLTVLDGPLHGIRHRRGLAIIGYVKTHHRRMLAREHWVSVPELTAGERSGLDADGAGPVSGALHPPRVRCVRRWTGRPPVKMAARPVVTWSKRAGSSPSTSTAPAAQLPPSPC